MFRARTPVQLHCETLERKQAGDRWHSAGYQWRYNSAITVTARCSSKPAPQMALQSDETLTLFTLSRLFMSIVRILVVLLHEDVINSAVTATCSCELERFLWSRCYRCYQCCAQLAASLPCITVHSLKGIVQIHSLRSFLMQLNTDSRLSACHPATNLNIQQVP